MRHPEWKEKGGETRMKHVKVLSTTKPACAEETSWLEFKNIFRRLDLTNEQGAWLGAQIDNWLQK